LNEDKNVFQLIQPQKPRNKSKNKIVRSWNNTQVSWIFQSKSYWPSSNTSF